jgi:hypothetical protein
MTPFPVDVSPEMYVTSVRYVEFLHSLCLNCNNLEFLFSFVHMFVFVVFLFIACWLCWPQAVEFSTQIIIIMMIMIMQLDASSSSKRDRSLSHITGTSINRQYDTVQSPVLHVRLFGVPSVRALRTRL